eukprot:TRINITY_DN54696_c0_g1_i1.p2 TRINITY_DN54696_c0_g1~~TRINITY_DN54696_c0_g1_i1.p2  ORF type:complete len:136 (-),score=48.44 TRINITY_DN54696_c0_g1_i1:40-447(-)
MYICFFLYFFFSSRRRHTRCREVSWARRCVQETGYQRRVHGAKRKYEHQINSICRNIREIATLRKNIMQKEIRKVDESKMSSMPVSNRSKSIISGNSRGNLDKFIPVSYTHLTLPTILLLQICVVAVFFKKKIKM